MKTWLFVAVIGLATIGCARHNEEEMNNVKFTPPVIVKNNEAATVQDSQAVRFTPPVILKDAPRKEQ